MTRALVLILLLAACREDAGPPPPVALTASSVGYFCQMNLLEHGGPKAQVHLDAYPGKPLFFSQVRDALSYLKMPEQDAIVTATYLNDVGAAASWDQMGATNWISLDKAVFVLGSDMMGGMGQPEIVPFADPARARAFAARHGGQVMTLDEIPSSALLPPEAAGSDSTGDADYSTRLRAVTDQTGG